jgi:hypothetical protein
MINKLEDLDDINRALIKLTFEQVKHDNSGKWKEFTGCFMVGRTKYRFTCEYMRTDKIFSIRSKKISEALN